MNGRAVGTALRLLLTLLVAIPAAGRAFTFSVMGDNRPKGGQPDVVTQPGEFHQSIREVNLLGPDMVVILGDLIMGYTEDTEMVVRQWDAFDAAKDQFRAPVHLVPGNHEVYSPKSRELYLKRAGALHYSFLHKGCRFLVLNSEDIDNPDRIAGEQLDWLRRELRRGGARRTFVFLHKPFWRYDEGTTNWMEEVHPLLVKAGVEAVFAGHWHHYERSADRDGIRYYITGGAGAELWDNPYAGDFHHHLLVEVPSGSSKPVRVHVVRTGFLDSDTVVTEEQRETAYALTEALTPARLRLVDGLEKLEAFDVLIQWEATNPYDAPVLARHELDPAESGAWTLEPDPSQALIPPGESAAVWLRFRGRGEGIFPAPVLRVSATREGETVVQSAGRVPLSFDRELGICRREGPVEVDGVLEVREWGACPSAGRFLATDASGFAEARTHVRALWDDEALYLAFRSEQPGADALPAGTTDQDWRTLSEDSIVVYLDPVRDGDSRYCFGVTAHGTPMEYRAPKGAVDVAWDPEWERAVSRDAEGWTLEVRIPFRLLEMEPAGGAELGLNAFRVATPGGREMTGWSLPVGGRISSPEGYGTAVLKLDPDRP